MGRRILVSNDDGYDAAGIAPLVEALEPLGEVWVVAPDRERSAQSHALTMHKPLRARERGPRHFACSGTPADCVYLGLHGLVEGSVDLIVSGINRGANLSNDVFYSGTVAAALEGCLHGVPAIASSLFIDFSQPSQDFHWHDAARTVARLAAQVLERGLPHRTLLNVNVPNVPEDAQLGTRVTTLGERAYELLVDSRTDPRGRTYHWIGGRHFEFKGIPGSDGPTVKEGYVSVTPLRADLTAHDVVSDLRAWPGLD